jgi:hypothetical protein
MNHKPRIELTDSIQAGVFKMSEGNPGALTVLMRTLKESSAIDPDSFMGELTGLLSLDEEGIYGSRIWMFFKDVSGSSLETMLGLLRCVQLGFLSSESLQHAIDNHGEGIDVDDLIATLHKRLPAFRLTETKFTV